MCSIPPMKEWTTRRRGKCEDKFPWKLTKLLGHLETDLRKEEALDV